MIYYFGTFNPIHIGHIKIANEISQAFKQEVCFIPAYDSPWKKDLNNFKHRCKMIKLSNQICLDIEKKLPTPSYTYNTVKYLQEFGRLRGDGKLQMIIGMDAFNNIEKWHKWEYLRQNCFFMVIPRKENIDIQKKIEDGFNFCIYSFEDLPYSSTMVRNGNLSKVTAKVREYILENKLY